MYICIYTYIYINIYIYICIRPRALCPEGSVSGLPKGPGMGW